MPFLDWMKRGQVYQKSDESHPGLAKGGCISVPRRHGRYPPAMWLETPQQFAEIIPKIQEHMDNKLEVRITNGDDHLLFHATPKGIEWDDI